MRADRTDIEALTEMRIEYIKADMGVSIEDEGIMVATALLLIIEKPSNPHFINGKVGNVLNVYTLEGYRHQGISTRLMQEIIFKRKRAGFY